MKKKRIFMGIRETSNNISSMSETLRKNDYDVFTYVRSNKLFDCNKYDYVKNNNEPEIIFSLKKALFFFTHLNKFDIYFYIYHERMLPFQLDLFILRSLNKVVIVRNCGGEVEYRKIHEKVVKEAHGFCVSDGLSEKAKERYFDNSSEFFRKNRINNFYHSLILQFVEDLSGCHIMSVRNQGTFLNKPFYTTITTTPQTIDGYKTASERPLIIHAPTDRVFKGTEYVLKAVSALKKEGLEFDFKLIQGLPHNKIIKLLKKTDILVDQPAYWLGILAREAMAAGCAVIGGNHPEIDGREEKNPAVQFTRNTKDLTDKIRELILDVEKRQSIMNESYDYWKKELSEERFMQFFEDLLAGKAKKTPPIKNNKRLIMKHCENPLQRLMAWLLMR